jgi:hypothetical protein
MFENNYSSVSSPVGVQLGAVKLYVAAAVGALKKNERQDETSYLSSKLQEQVKRVETDRSRPLIALQDFPDNSIVIWKFNKYSNFI